MHVRSGRVYVPTPLRKPPILHAHLLAQLVGQVLQGHLEGHVAHQMAGGVVGGVVVAAAAHERAASAHVAHEQRAQPGRNVALVGASVMEVEHKHRHDH